MQTCESIAGKAVTLHVRFASDPMSTSVQLPQNGPDISDADWVYTPLADAVAELARRRADTGLREKAERFQSEVPPTFMPDVPFGAIGRFIATPSHEYARFIALAASVGLRPLYLEHTDDFFFTQNRDKYRLYRPAFDFSPRQPRSFPLFKFAGSEMRRLSSLKTRGGLSLVEYHHQLIERAFPDNACTLVNFSSWLALAPRGEPFYLRYLAPYVAHGILFESFIESNLAEMRFFRERVVPSVRKIEEIFGVRPLIVRLLPAETEGDDYWTWLPGSLFEFARELCHKSA